MRSVAAAICPINTAGDELATATKWCSAIQYRLISPLFGVLREVDGVAQRGRGVAALADRREVEDRQRHGHVGSTLA